MKKLINKNYRITEEQEKFIKSWAREFTDKNETLALREILNQFITTYKSKKN